MRTRIPAALFVVFVSVLCWSSPKRITGDGLEYKVLAERFAGGSGPSIPVDDAKAAAVYDGRLIDRHGYQQVAHFWMFPLFVAPLVWIAPDATIWAFTAFNAVLLGLAFWITYRRLGSWAAVFLGCSPLIWWIDKAQVEVFTVTAITLACVMADRPLLTTSALALASTQNPPLAGLAVLLLVFTPPPPNLVALDARSGPLAPASHLLPESIQQAHTLGFV